MSWSNAYVGLPFRDKGRSDAGLDCWGLVRLVYARELGIALPSYAETYVSVEERREIAAVIDQEQTPAIWRPVTWPGAAFDVLLFTVGDYPSHVGLVVTAGLMLHVARPDHAKLARFDTPPWAGRLAGVFRHRALGGPS